MIMAAVSKYVTGSIPALMTRSGATVTTTL